MEIINKAKDLLGVAGEKTSGFVYSQKCNIKIARVCADLKKAYERFGRLSYRQVKGIKYDKKEYDALLEKIEVLKMQLNALREQKLEEPKFESIVFEDGELVSDDTDN